MVAWGVGRRGPGGRGGWVTSPGGGPTGPGAGPPRAAVGAEAYSFGQTSSDPSGGTPNTFIFAFGNVGGAPIFPNEGEGPAAPAPAPVAAPAASVVVADLEPAAVSGDELASTGAEPAGGLLAAALLAFAGIGLVTTAALRRRLD